MVVFFGMFTIIGPANLAYASAERIFLVQQYEQFPGQEISGYCDLVDNLPDLDVILHFMHLAEHPLNFDENVKNSYIYKSLFQ